MKDLGEKADQTLEKAGAEPGSALRGAAEKADSTIQRAAEKADGTLQRAAERADGKLSELASKASGALGLDEPSGPGSSVGLTESFLINQKFVLRKINEADFSGTSALPAPKLEFGEGFMVYGRVCNNFRGQGRLADGRLTVPAVASTRMACVDDTFGQLENRLFTMLEKGAEITMNGAFLTLKEGETTLLFEADASI